MYYILLLLLCNCCFALQCSDLTSPSEEDVPFVETEYGSIVGKKLKIFGNDVLAFLGIPYAEPPVGDKRFTKPTPISQWKGIFNATVKPPPCMQFSSRNYSWIPASEPSEDCLFLNVWTPAKLCDDHHELPVLVWIHGGGFYSGSSEMDVYDGSILASKGNVVLVSMNYRVGIFGFMNGGHEEAPGNVGLYDQNLALRWVRKNIDHFGGNTENITLIGEGAGSISTSIHVVSPLSRGLFRRAILQSGAATNTRLLHSYSKSLSAANSFARIVNCSSDDQNLQTDSSDIMKCLKQKDALELAKTEDLFTSQKPHLFLPTVGEDYIPKPPLKILNSGDYDEVQVLIGDNKDEGTISLNYIKPKEFPLDGNATPNLSDAEKLIRVLFQAVPDPTADEIFEFYFKNLTDDDGEEIVKAISNSYGDYVFDCPDMLLAEKMKSAYFYWMTHRSAKDPNADWVGVPHFSEVPYVFGVPLREDYKYTSEDEKFSDSMIKKWTNFARYGHPLQDGSEDEWPPFTASNPVVFELSSQKEGKLRFPRADACEFWRPYLLSSAG